MSTTVSPLKVVSEESAAILESFGVPLSSTFAEAVRVYRSLTQSSTACSGLLRPGSNHRGAAPAASSINSTTADEEEDDDETGLAAVESAWREYVCVSQANANMQASELLSWLLLASDKGNVSMAAAAAAMAPTSISLSSSSFCRMESGSSTVESASVAASEEASSGSGSPSSYVSMREVANCLNQLIQCITSYRSETNPQLLLLPEPEAMSRVVSLFVSSPSAVIRLLALRLVTLCRENSKFLWALFRDEDCLQWIGLCGDRPVHQEVCELFIAMRGILERVKRQRLQAGEGVSISPHDATGIPIVSSAGDITAATAAAVAAGSTNPIQRGKAFPGSPHPAPPPPSRTTRAATRMAVPYQPLAMADLPVIPMAWYYRVASYLDPSEAGVNGDFGSNDLASPRGNAAVLSSAFDNSDPDNDVALALERQQLALDVARLAVILYPAQTTAVGLHHTLLKACTVPHFLTEKQVVAVVYSILEMFDAPFTRQYMMLSDIRILFAPFLSVGEGSNADDLVWASHALVALLSHPVGVLWANAEAGSMLALSDLIYLPDYPAKHKVTIITLLRSVLARLSPHRGLCGGGHNLVDGCGEEKSFSIHLPTSTCPQSVTDVCGGGHAVIHVKVPTTIGAGYHCADFELGNFLMLMEALGMGTAMVALLSQTTDVSSLEASYSLLQEMFSLADTTMPRSRVFRFHAKLSVSTGGLAQHARGFYLSEINSRNRRKGLMLRRTTGVHGYSPPPQMLSATVGMVGSSNSGAGGGAGGPGLAFPILLNGDAQDISLHSTEGGDPLYSPVFNTPQQASVRWNPNVESIGELVLQHLNDPSQWDADGLLILLRQAQLVHHVDELQKYLSLLRALVVFFTPAYDPAFSTTSYSSDDIYGASILDRLPVIRSFRYQRHCQQQQQQQQQQQPGHSGSSGPHASPQSGGVASSLNGPIHFIHLPSVMISPALCHAASHLAEVLLLMPNGMALLTESPELTTDATADRRSPTSLPLDASGFLGAFNRLLEDVRDGDFKVLPKEAWGTCVTDTLLSMVGRLSSHAKGISMLRRHRTLAHITEIVERVRSLADLGGSGPGACGLDGEAAATTEDGLGATPNKAKLPRPHRPSIRDHLPFSRHTPNVVVMCHVVSGFLRHLHHGTIQNFGVCKEVRDLFPMAFRIACVDVRRTAVQQLRDLTCGDVGGAARWYLEVLLQVLHDPDPQVLSTAFQLLSISCEYSSDALDYMISLSPVVLMESVALAPLLSKSILLYRMAMRPSGFRFLQCFDWVRKELAKWEKSNPIFTGYFVTRVQAHQPNIFGFTPPSAHPSANHSGRRGSVGGDYHLPSNSSPTTPSPMTVVAMRSYHSERFFPLHILTVLAGTREGCVLLDHSTVWKSAVRRVVMQPLPPPLHNDEDDSSGSDYDDIMYHVTKRRTAPTRANQQQPHPTASTADSLDSFNPSQLLLRNANPSITATEANTSQWATGLASSSADAEKLKDLQKGLLRSSSNNNTSSTNSNGRQSVPHLLSLSRGYQPLRQAFSIDCVGSPAALMEAIFCICAVASTEEGFKLVTSSSLTADPMVATATGTTTTATTTSNATANSPDLSLIRRIFELNAYCSTLSVRLAAQLGCCMIARCPSGLEALQQAGYSVHNNLSSYICSSGTPYSVSFAYLRRSMRAFTSRKPIKNTNAMSTVQSFTSTTSKLGRAFSVSTASPHLASAAAAGGSASRSQLPPSSPLSPPVPPWLREMLTALPSSVGRENAKAGLRQVMQKRSYVFLFPSVQQFCLLLCGTYRMRRAEREFVADLLDNARPKRKSGAAAGMKGAGNTPLKGSS